jgi:hypothetical protein
MPSGMAWLTARAIARVARWGAEPRSESGTSNSLPTPASAGWINSSTRLTIAA